MKRIVAVLGGVLAMLVLPTLASAQAVHSANSPRADLLLTEPLVVGSATLSPGDYRFQCKRIGEQEFLVVTSAEDGREVARVPCKPEALEKKVDISDFRSVAGPDGVHSLTAVRIKGESMAHRVILH